MDENTFDNIYQNKLTPKQKEVIPFVLQGLSNKEIADKLFITPSAVSHRISGIAKIFEAMDAKHLIEMFYQYRPQMVSQKAIKKAGITATTILDYEIPYPEGSELVNSPLYLARENIDTRGKSLINKQGCLIKIKAPKQMGKTSLIDRLVDYAIKQDNYIIYYDFSFIDVATLSDINSFFYSLALFIAEEISDLTEKEIKLNAWNKENSLTTECTKFLKKILKDLDKPLILIFDETDRIFQYESVYQSFAPMLRYWHENGRRNPIWKKLKLVLSHSTEEYIKLDINQSPFANVGVTINLEDFTPQQLTELASKHGINNQQTIGSLMKLVGGHPYLIRLALYYLSQEGLSLSQLLAEAATDSGIYKQHLQRHLDNLQKSLDLKEAFGEVIKSPTPVAIKEQKFKHQLQGMGLIKMQGNGAEVRYELYRKYFGDYLI